MMPLDFRPTQVAIQEETTPGTFVQPDANDVVCEVEVGTDPDVDPQFADQDPARDTASMKAKIRGRSSISTPLKIQLVGGGDGTTPPAADAYLKMAGHLRLTVNSIDLTGAPTGTFRFGERITDGGTKIARFVKMLDADTMLYAVVSGAAFANGDTITGDTSGATGAPAVTENITPLGFAYYPATYGHLAHSLEIIRGRETAAGNGIKFTSEGSRASGSIEIGGSGQLGFLNLSAQGKFDPATRAPQDSAFYSASPSVPTPETLLSAGVQVGSDLICVSNITLDFGNPLSLLECANDASGYQEARINGKREPKISTNPAAELEADVEFWTTLEAGTTLGFFAQVGATAGKRWCIVAPFSQYNDIGLEDAENTMRYGAEFDLTADDDYPYMIVFF